MAVLFCSQTLAQKNKTNRLDRQKENPAISESNKNLPKTRNTRGISLLCQLTNINLQIKLSPLYWRRETGVKHNGCF